MVVAPSRRRQNAAKSRSPTRPSAATVIASASRARGWTTVSRTRSGSRCDGSSQSRYRYRREVAENRASNPAGATVTARTTMSLGRMPRSRLASASAGVRSPRPGRAAYASSGTST